MTKTMQKFSELEHDHKVKIGHLIGHHVIGGTASPESVIEDGFLENHNIIPDVNPMDDSVVCAAFDEIAFCCTHCNWYCEMSECNDDRRGDWCCDGCKAVEDGDDGEEE